MLKRDSLAGMQPACPSAPGRDNQGTALGGTAPSDPSEGFCADCAGEMAGATQCRSEKLRMSDTMMKEAQD